MLLALSGWLLRMFGSYAGSAWPQLLGMGGHCNPSHRMQQRHSCNP